ncbi:MAG: hypothetical protein GF355_15510 [Candidatus Eisenbacteria bacterium]|nr:hypothetical protein [Candidatus Eisenbacteria bacterium]
MLKIEQTIEELRSRKPFIRWRVLRPDQVRPFLDKLGYDDWYDRCKYDVITFHEDGREQALVIWNLVQGPDRQDPPKPWERAGAV